MAILESIFSKMPIMEILFTWSGVGGKNEIICGQVKTKENDDECAKCQWSYCNQCKAHITFAEYAIEAFINKLSYFLSVKNIKFSRQSCIIQWDHLMKNCIFVIHVISHAKQSTIKKSLYFRENFVWENSNNARESEFSKIKGNICNIPIEAANIWI